MFVVVVCRLRPCAVKFHPQGAAKELQLGRGRELGLAHEKELRFSNGPDRLKI